MNLLSLASTFKWQRRLQAEMARDGYDESKTRTLNRTNWIRTGAYWIQVLMAMSIVVRALD